MSNKGKILGYERPMGEVLNTYDGKFLITYLSCFYSKTNNMLFPFTGKLGAIRLFNKYQTSRNNPVYAKIKLEDVEEDHLQHILGRFGIWLANVSLPRYHDKNFELRKTMVGKSIEYLSVDAKKKYFERMKAVLKHKFCCHNDWDDEKEWWETMSSNFTKEANRNKQLSVDNEDNDRSIRPLYKQNQPQKIQMKREIEEFHHINEIDLQFVCENVCNMCFIYYYCDCLLLTLFLLSVVNKRSRSVQSQL